MDCSELRVEIPKCQVRQPAVSSDQREQSFVRLALLKELHRRDQERLIEDVDREIPMLGAAEVRRMRDRPREGNEFAAPENWAQECDIHRLASPDPGVVGDEDIAWVEHFSGEPLQ